VPSHHYFFFFSSRRRHTRSKRDWSSDVCSSDLPTIAESLALCHAVYQSASNLIQQKYQARPLVADEGGLAPNFPSSTAMIEDAMESIAKAGLKPGKDVSIAIDLASSHFYENGRYQLDHLSLDPGGMIEVIRKWTRQYPIV